MQLSKAYKVLYFMLSEGLITFPIFIISVCLCKRILIGCSWATYLSWNSLPPGEWDVYAYYPEPHIYHLGQEVPAPRLIVLELHSVEQSSFQKEVLWAKQNSNSWLLQLLSLK